MVEGRARLSRRGRASRHRVRVSRRGAEGREARRGRAELCQSSWAIFSPSRSAASRPSSPLPKGRGQGVGPPRRAGNARDLPPNPHPQPVDAARQLRFPQGEGAFRSSPLRCAGSSRRRDPAGIETHRGWPRGGAVAPQGTPRLGETPFVCYTLPADVEICDGLRNLRSAAWPFGPRRKPDDDFLSSDDTTHDPARMLRAGT